MLRVVYEAVESLESGGLAHISEVRGGTRVCVVRGSEVEAYTHALNVAMQEFLDGAEWFQLWRDEVIARSDGTCSLNVVFSIHDLDDGDYVEIQESKGLVDIRVERTASVDQFVKAANPAIQEFLDGGQWFQLWQGEIVDMDSPEGRAA